MHEKKIYFATCNTGKVKYVQEVLKKYDIDVSHYKLDLIEPRSNDLEEIAVAKVKQAFNLINKPCIAIDSGFYIKELNNFPGSYVNFALETIGIEGILRLIADEKRDCCFNNCLVYFDDILENPIIFNSKVNGQLAVSKKGKMQDYSWSELFLLFIPEGEVLTLGEMDRNYFNSWRQENRTDSSAELFGKWYTEYLNHYL